MTKSGPTQIPEELWAKAIKSLAEGLREKRMSQADLATALGLSGPTISGWFNGKRATKDNIERALRAVGRETASIFGANAGAEPWEDAARAAGYDPSDPTVKRIYSGAFDRAMAGAAETIEAINLRGNPDESGEITTRRPNVRYG